MCCLIKMTDYYSSIQHVFILFSMYLFYSACIHSVNILLLCLNLKLKVVCSKALSDLWCDGGVALDLDDCFELEAVSGC